MCCVLLHKIPNISWSNLLECKKKLFNNWIVSSKQGVDKPSLKNFSLYSNKKKCPMPTIRYIYIYSE